MSLPLHTTVTVSSEASQEQTGPTLVHSTGVQNYRIQPEVIRFLQESCTNDNLCDHEQGVQCTHPPAHILQVFENAGFTVTSQSTSGSRKLWILTKTGGGGSNPHPAPPPPSGGGGGGHHPNQEEEEEQPGDEEEQEEEEEEEEK